MKVKLDDGAYMPEKAYRWDAGYDLRTPERVIVRAHDSVVIDTGVHFEIPHGFVGFLKSKSGLNVKYDLLGEGVIDSSYTGSVRVKLYNHGGQHHIFERGDKVIQIVFLAIYSPDLELVDELEDTDRGGNGFGSSGR